MSKLLLLHLRERASQENGERGKQEQESELKTAKDPNRSAKLQASSSYMRARSSSSTFPLRSILAKAGGLLWKEKRISDRKEEKERRGAKAELTRRRSLLANRVNAKTGLGKTVEEEEIEGLGRIE